MKKFQHHGLGRHDRKLAGVCADLGTGFNIDPTFVRVGFAALAILVSFKLALGAYVAAGLWIHFEKKKLRQSGQGSLRDDESVRSPRASVRDLRTRLDANDRRLMAIDRHLATPNDDLAREIEALREEVK